MPIRNVWRPFTFESIKSISVNIGAYELGDAKGIVVYIGSGQVKSRLLKHKERSRFMHVKFFRFQKLHSRADATDAENRLCALFKKQHGGKLPRLQERAPTTPTSPYPWRR